MVVEIQASFIRVVRGTRDPLENPNPAKAINDQCMKERADECSIVRWTADCPGRGPLCAPRHDPHINKLAVEHVIRRRPGAMITLVTKWWPPQPLPALLLRHWRWLFYT